MVTNRALLLDIQRSLLELHVKADLIMTTQDDINAVVTELQGAVVAIQAEIAALEQQIANGQPVDLTGLKAAADAVAAIAAPPATP